MAPWSIPRTWNRRPMPAPSRGDTASSELANGPDRKLADAMRPHARSSMTSAPLPMTRARWWRRQDDRRKVGEARQRLAATGPGQQPLRTLQSEGGRGRQRHDRASTSILITPSSSRSGLVRPRLSSRAAGPATPTDPRAGSPREATVGCAARTRPEFGIQRIGERP
jgi:hypothetical protein